MLSVISVIYPAYVLFSIHLAQKAETRVDVKLPTYIIIQCHLFQSQNCDKEISLFRDI